MTYQLTSGDIKPKVLYKVAGEQTVLYDGIQYASDEYFRGLADKKTFSFIGVGTQEIIEVGELRAGSVEYLASADDSFIFGESTLLKDFAVEYALNELEKTVNEKTEIKAFALELLDFPFFSFMVQQSTS